MDVHTHHPVLVMDVGWKDLNKPLFYFYIPIASVSIRILSYPLLLVKTQIQTRGLNETKILNNNNMHQNISMSSIAKRIFKYEGYAGFYKGFGVSLNGLIVGPIYATVYEMCREYTFQQLNQPPIASSFIGGICASCIAQVIQAPIDVVTQSRMILQGADVNTNALEIIRNVIRIEGSVFGLWRGFGLAISSYAPTSAIVWSTFMNNKTILEKYNMFDTECEYFGVRNACLTFASGTVAGFIGSFITMPVDTLKTRRQTMGNDSISSLKVMESIKQVYKYEGIRGFYCGVLARMYSSSIAAGFLLTGYDFLKWMTKIQNNAGRIGDQA